MTTNQPLYCTLYNAQIGNLSGVKINVAEANRFLFNLKEPKTMISRQMAQHLQATAQELSQGEMTIEIVLNSDPISFEAKLDRGEIPSIPKWATLKVAIKSEVEMRIFDLIIGNDATFKAKASDELWQKHISAYKKNKKMPQGTF